MQQIGFILSENEHKYYSNDPNTQVTLYSSSIAKAITCLQNLRI